MRTGTMPMTYGLHNLLTHTSVPAQQLHRILVENGDTGLFKANGARATHATALHSVSQLCFASSAPPLQPTGTAARPGAVPRAMAMNHGWGRAAEPSSFEQRLNAHDCDVTIGELVLRGDVARLFSLPRAVPLVSRGLELRTGRLHNGQPFASYDAALELHSGQRSVVEVLCTGAAGHGREMETLFRDGWRDICEDFELVPGDVAVFSEATRTAASVQGRTVLARFYDAGGNERLSLSGWPDPPSSPVFHFQGSPSSPAFHFQVDRVRAQGAEEERGGEQFAGAGGGGGALLGDDMTIKEAMDLAVECGAREGSDEHYMATRLFVKAENRAMFLTFRTNAGRLQWLRRCFQDWNN